MSLGAGRPFVIAGGGIGGLSTALALARVGLRSVVLEKRAKPVELGAGIQLTPNAGKALAWLGIADEAIDKVAVRPDRLEIRSAANGQPLAVLPLGANAVASFGAPHRTLHRVDLLRLVLDAAKARPEIELRPSSEVTAFSAQPDGVLVSVRAPAGSVDIGAAGLIGADGVGSTVRVALAGATITASTGRTAWRAVVAGPVTSPAPTDAIVIWLGRGGHMVHYPISRHGDLNLVVVLEGSRLSEERDLPTRLASWSADALAILKLPQAWTKWPILTVDPTGSWGSERVTLLGDAAHAFPPYLAQGAAFAMEDAVTLGTLVGRRPDDLAGAFAAYRSLRLDRTRRLHRAAEAAGSIYHLRGPMAVARDLALRIAGERLLHRYDWIYRWAPPG